MKMKGLDRARELFGSFSFMQFSTLREFRLFEDEGDQGPVYSIEMTMVSQESAMNGMLALKFKDVRKVTLEDFTGVGDRITGFDIREISDRQWEGIAWEVFDYEEKQMHFFAREAEIIEARRT